MALTRVTAPLVMPVTLPEAKAHLRIDETDTYEDDVINQAIADATAAAETILNRKLINQTWKKTLDGWPWDGVIELPFGNFQSIVHVKWWDSDGTEHTVSSDNYGVDTSSLCDGIARLKPKPSVGWPSGTLADFNPIEVQFECGYGASHANVPADIRAAIKNMISDAFENRGSVVIGTVAVVIKMTMAAENLLYPHRNHEMPL